MNNLPPRFYLIGIGVLIMISMVINHFLNKELSPVKAAATTVYAPQEPEPVAAATNFEQKNYDPLSDYAPVPSGVGLQQEVFETKKLERTPSQKIIYEMPTSNKILLQ